MLKQAATSTAGFVKKSKKSATEDSKELYWCQINHIDFQKKEEKRTIFKMYQNWILAEIHTIIKAAEKEKVKKTRSELQNMQKDNNRIYKVVQKSKTILQKLAAH